MAITKRTRRVIYICAVAVIVAAFVGWTWDAFWAVRFGSPLTRQVVTSQWLNQQSRLSFCQKHVLITLLYTDVDDPAAVGEALAVLKAHMKEDEDEIVRHLVYVALTASNPDDAAVALSGLKSV